MREGSPPSTCHVSHILCHVSCVACHVSHVTCQMSHFFDRVVKLVSGGSVINGATPFSSSIEAVLPLVWLSLPTVIWLFPFDTVTKDSKKGWISQEVHCLSY